MEGPPLRALVISDGVVGHDRISLGVIAAMRRRGAVEERWIGVRQRRGGSRRWDRLLARHLPFDRFWPGRFAEVGHAGAPGGEGVPAGPFAFVVSAGPSTNAANIALARRYGARSVCFGFPKLPFVAEFDVLLRPDRPRLGLSRGVTVLRPSEIDPDLLPAPERGPDGPRRVAVLIGGDTKHHSFSSLDFETLAAAMRAMSARSKVTLFNSRRTPEAPFDAFVAGLARGGAAIDVVDFRTGGFLSNGRAFEADAIVVTADSMSMIAEAIAARRPTLIARPDGYRAPARDAAEIAAHIAAGHAGELSFSALAGGWRGALNGLRPLAYHPLERLADVVLGPRN